ncbi:hypothetical protein QJS10_CPA16g00269 [Acorus calamus]|uniref:Uncharacterized protein n=1 Tax=Acorus calamus TaxID=4465 RepID=A0AAV9D2X0_ACOCL|nr:hypothetical protein QJS10_CPA16g00269 [Acorus calamus]
MTASTADDVGRSVATLRSAVMDSVLTSCLIRATAGAVGARALKGVTVDMGCVAMLDS